MTKVIEAVRQLRGEANPEVQIPGCEIVFNHGLETASALEQELRH